MKFAATLITALFVTGVLAADAKKEEKAASAAPAKEVKKPQVEARSDATKSPSPAATSAPGKEVKKDNNK